MRKNNLTIHTIGTINCPGYYLHNQKCKIIKIEGFILKVKFLEDPPASVTTAAPKSGLGIVSRLDYGFNWTAYYLEFFMDINVA